MAIDGRPNTVLMPGLDCSPNGSVWTNYANFWLFWASYRYHFRQKHEENLATLFLSAKTAVFKHASHK